jgi:hypothetical protein
MPETSLAQVPQAVEIEIEIAGRPMILKGSVRKAQITFESDDWPVCELTFDFYELKEGDIKQLTVGVPMVRMIRFKKGESDGKTKRATDESGGTEAAEGNQS